MMFNDNNGFVGTVYFVQVWKSDFFFFFFEVKLYIGAKCDTSLSANLHEI